MSKPWRKAAVGEPLLVRTVEQEPSYWIVPVVCYLRVLGYIEIDLDGRILGHAYFYQDPDDLTPCPRTVTRLTAEEAYEQAREILKTYVGAEFTEPVFVHDGPHNKLAWMIEVKIKDKLAARVFVTPGYTYQRKVGEIPSRPGWRGTSLSVNSERT